MNLPQLHTLGATSAIGCRSPVRQFREVGIALQFFLELPFSRSYTQA